MNICLEKRRFLSFIKFWSGKRNTENIITDYSEEHSSTFERFQFEPEKKNNVWYESHEKEATEAVVCRYSSK